MPEIEVPNELSEEEAEKYLQRKAKRKGDSSSGSSQSSENDGSIWFWVLIGLGILAVYGVETSGILL
ncbi:MAG: hypothetical protein ABEI77_02300 [Halorientalis sp.]